MPDSNINPRDLAKAVSNWQLVVFACGLVGTAAVGRYQLGDLEKKAAAIETRIERMNDEQRDLQENRRLDDRRIETLEKSVEENGRVLLRVSSTVDLICYALGPKCKRD